MRVLLINSNTKDDLLSAPPIGLCYVAEATEHAGHEVKLVDLCFSGRSRDRRLREAVRSFGPQVVGISVRNIDNVNMLHPISYIPDVEHIVREVRSLTDVPLILGGTGTTLMPAHLGRHLGADYVVAGDGEQSFPRLIDALERNEDPGDIPGVGMLIEGRFRLTPSHTDGFSVTRPELGKWVDMRPYRKVGSSYNIQTKRGCRRNCIYCTYNQALEGRTLRLRPPVDVVDEIEEALFRYRPDTFEFVDSVFNDPVEHSMEILEEIVRRPWSAHFTAMGVHPTHLDSKYLDLMLRAGFRSLMITPESASATMIRNYRKGFDLDDVHKAAEAINGTGIAAWWFFMIGGPGESNDTLQQSLDFALNHLQKRGRPVTNVAHFFMGVRVYPGTTLWDIAVKEGFVVPDANPLDPLWYISEELDLDRAVRQMNRAASQAPEVYLGYDERILMFSKVAAWFFDLLRFPKPYWRYFRAANRFGLKTGIRFMFFPTNLPHLMREILRKQGYSGPLVRGQLEAKPSRGVGTSA